MIGSIGFTAEESSDTVQDQFSKSEWQEITNNSAYIEKNRGKDFNKNEWQEITKNKDYSEQLKDKKPKKPSKPKKLREPRHFNWKIPAGLVPFLKVLLYVFIIGLLSFLIFLLLKKGFGYFNDKVKKPELSTLVENLENNLDKADFEDLLDKAIREGEYKLAVRIYYLRTIRFLSDKEFIQWRRNKTNGSYVIEMAGKPGGKEFAFLTTIYEHVWFGDFEVKPDTFNLISAYFKQFLPLRF
jgi:hypothetical protein